MHFFFKVPYFCAFVVVPQVLIRVLLRDITSGLQLEQLCIAVTLLSPSEHWCWWQWFLPTEESLSLLSGSKLLPAMVSNVVTDPVPKKAI